VNPLAPVLTVNPERYLELQPKAGSMSAALPAVELQKMTEQTGPVTASPPGVGGGSFAGFLGQMVREVSAKQGVADAAVDGLLTGENVSLHQAMISMEEANVSFQLMVEVRNRLLDSYQELMRMQI
jgi:flagellar hook-basal body complex protein FliE